MSEVYELRVPLNGMTAEDLRDWARMFFATIDSLIQVRDEHKDYDGSTTMTTSVPNDEFDNIKAVGDAMLHTSIRSKGYDDDGEEESCGSCHVLSEVYGDGEQMHCDLNSRFVEYVFSGKPLGKDESVHISLEEIKREVIDRHFERDWKDIWEKIKDEFDAEAEE